MKPLFSQNSSENPPPQQECIPYATERFSLTGIGPISLFSPFAPPCPPQQHSTPPEKRSLYDEIDLRQAPAGLNNQTYQTTIPYHPMQALAFPHTRNTEEVHIRTHHAYLKKCPQTTLIP